MAQVAMFVTGFSFFFALAGARFYVPQVAWTPRGTVQSYVPDSQSRSLDAWHSRLPYYASTKPIATAEPIVNGTSLSVFALIGGFTAALVHAARPKIRKKRRPFAMLAVASTEGAMVDVSNLTKSPLDEFVTRHGGKRVIQRISMFVLTRSYNGFS